MKLLTGALLVAATAVLAPLATAQGVKVYIDGLGAMKCTTILTSLKDQPVQAQNAIIGWTYGYMTRRNIERGVAGQTQVDFSNGKVPPEQVLGVISGFCEKNADARLFEIAEGLYNVLLEGSAITS